MRERGENVKFFAIMAHSPRAVKLVGQKGKNVRRKFYALLFLGGPEIGGVGKEVEGRV